MVKKISHWKVYLQIVWLLLSLFVYYQALTGNWFFDKLYFNMAVLQPIFILIGLFTYPYYIRYIIRKLRA